MLSSSKASKVLLREEKGWLTGVGHMNPGYFTLVAIDLKP